jgi:hypothetical protein
MRGTLGYRKGPPPHGRIAEQRPVDIPPITMADVDKRIGERIARERLVWARAIAERIVELQDDIDKGVLGKPGPRGERGDQGPPGKLPSVRVWKEGQISYAFDVVTHAGGTFQARRDTAKTPGEGDDWTVLAQAGQDGAMPHICGTYDPDTKYRLLDICALNGSSFISKRDDPGECPGDGWQLIASHGKRGDKGDRGEPGVRGITGERGLKGDPGASIVGWNIDPATYTAFPLMSDGQQGPGLELREIFKQFVVDAR